MLLNKSARYELLDALRGLTLLSMIAYHTCWDLVWIFGIDWPWYHTFGAFLWQQSICWTFILLSGFCWPLGHHPIKRGSIVFLCGAAIMAVTALFMPQNRVLFGVLTLLGSCMLLLCPFQKLLQRIPPAWGGSVSFLLFLALRDINRGFLVGFQGTYLFHLPEWLYQNAFTAYLGFPPAGFSSVDYFPLLPWSLLFLTGYFLCGLLRPHLRDLPCRCTFLCSLGRCSLTVYLLHQPFIYAVLSLLFLPQ